MPNSKDSSTYSARGIYSPPMWYVWFCKTYWPAWWIGTALIVCSWNDIVTRNVGWIGFCLAGLAALGSYILPSLAGIKPADVVILDSHLLEMQGEAYLNVIERFRRGAWMWYDGVAFYFQPNNQLLCGVSADSINLDKDSAVELADHAKSVTDQLISQSPEFASIVDGHALCISIMSGLDENAYELCRVVQGKLDWNC